MKKLIVLALAFAASSAAHAASHWECLAPNDQANIVVLTPGMRQPIRSGDHMTLGIKDRPDPSYPTPERTAPYDIWGDGTVNVSFDVGFDNMRVLVFVIKPDGSATRTWRSDGHAEKSELVCQWYPQPLF